jgi:hypothetical protein
MIKKKQAAILSLESTPIMLSWDEAKEFLQCEGFCLVSVSKSNPHLVTNNDMSQKIFFVICCLEVISQESWHKLF